MMVDIAGDFARPKFRWETNALCLKYQLDKFYKMLLSSVNVEYVLQVWSGRS